MAFAAAVLCFHGAIGMRAAGAAVSSASGEALAVARIHLAVDDRSMSVPRDRASHASSSDTYLTARSSTAAEWDEASRLAALMRLHAAIAHHAVFVENVGASISRVGREQQLPASMAMSLLYRPRGERRTGRPAGNHALRMPPYR